MKEEDIKNGFASLCWGLSKIDNKWDFWWNLIESVEDENKKIYREKMEKLLEILNNNDKELLEMDIEKEIWNML